MSLILPILPVLLLVGAGYALRASGTIAQPLWAGIDMLGFRLLIPAMVVHAIYHADLGEVAAGPFVPLLVVALTLVALGAFLLRLVMPGLPDASFTTIFQTGTRWNAFIALSAAEQFAGREALAWLAVAMAATIAVINMVNILVLEIWGTPPEGARTGLGAMFHSVFRNPMVQASLLGLALNLFAVPVPEVLMNTLGMAAAAALPVGLLCVGAGLMPRRLVSASAPMWAGLMLRPVIAPLIFAAGAWALGMPHAAFLAGAFVLAVPAAANGYVVARQMGGDAELYAAILTWQTLLCLPMLPLVAFLADRLSA